ncbi:MAG TPA: N-formylglutamate amidohydrolase [Stellaceae bacterium]
MTETIPGILFHSNAEAAEVPLVFDSPHSGTIYPEDFRFACPFEVLRTAEDTYVEELYGAAPAHGATLLAALFPRSYLDVNRDVADIDPDLLDGPWPGPLSPGEKTRLGLGLVRRLAKPGMPVYDRKLSVAEVQARIARCYEPYHAALQAACDRLHRKFGAVWHVDCHSMPSEGNAMSTDPGACRADFVLGDRDGTTCDPALTDFVGRVLRGRGYSLKVNDPYKGVELVRRHGRPAEGRHSLQIEVNRALYMDEKTLVKTAGLDRLKADITHLIEALAGFADPKQVRE